MRMQPEQVNLPHSDRVSLRLAPQSPKALKAERRMRRRFAGMSGIMDALKTWNVREVRVEVEMYDLCTPLTWRQLRAFNYYCEVVGD